LARTIHLQSIRESDVKKLSDTELSKDATKILVPLNDDALFHCLNWKDKFSIVRFLASGDLQVYKHVWPNGNWRSQDIFGRLRAIGLPELGTIFVEPVIRGKFRLFNNDRPNSLLEKKINPSQLWTYRFLRSFGLFLIELGLEKNGEDISSDWSEVSVDFISHLIETVDIKVTHADAPLVSGTIEQHPQVPDIDNEREERVLCCRVEVRKNWINAISVFLNVIRKAENGSDIDLDDTMSSVRVELYAEADQELYLTS
jgi:hypothetical protein